MDQASDLDLDLAHTPFSRRGSYFAVSRLARPGQSGLFLRTVHGDARQKELLRFDIGGIDAPIVRTTAGRLTLTGPDGSAELALDGGRAILRVLRGTLTLEMQVRSTYDVVLRETADTWRFVASGANRNYRICVGAGHAHLDSGWDGIKDASARLSVSAAEEPVTVVIDEFAMTPPPPSTADLDAVATAAEVEFEDWLGLHGSPSDDRDLTAATRLATYVTWSALVPAGGLLKRESMLMSKNNMAHIWSWDHCFNAIALFRDPGAAADQLLTLFDHQDEHGALPDHIDDARVQPNFVKPPVHGWAISCLMDRNGLTDAALTALYRPLARWTEWWFAHRDYGGDGVPSYNHGNDSGWDNSTVFARGVPLQSPDLLAFLALQQDTLARMAAHLGLPDVLAWRDAASRTIELLLRHFWRDDRFVARHSLTGEDIEADSLLTLMPLVLGARLPQSHFEAMVRRLEHGGYLTDYGVATEPLTSPHYVANGYWRGPIWAPTTLLIIDGLRHGGRSDLAGVLASRFLATCAKSGMAENFDARNGDGLRDRSMTWTASVYLTLLGDKVGGAICGSRSSG
jgi:glycogen debranching enzyme